MYLPLVVSYSFCLTRIVSLGVQRLILVPDSGRVILVNTAAQEFLYLREPGKQTLRKLLIFGAHFILAIENLYMQCYLELLMYIELLI